MKTTEIIGKKVLDCNANNVGKIQDIDMDLKSNNINKIIINNSGELSLRKVNYEVSPDMIAQVGDYILLTISKSDLNSNKEETPDVEIVDPSELEEKSKNN